VRIYVKLPMLTRISGRKIDLSSQPKFEVAANFDSFSPVQFETPAQSQEYPSKDSAAGMVALSQEVIIHGSIVNIKSELFNRRHRLGIRIKEKDPSKALVTRFISRRQSELTREIRNIYDMIASEKKDIIT
jgi:hypothetical protein